MKRRWTMALLRIPNAAGASGGLSSGADAGKAARWVLGALALGLFVYAYFIRHTIRLGITGSPAGSVLLWLWKSWSRGEEYAHGFVIPIVAGVIAYWRWKSVLRSIPPRVAPAGLAFIGMALALYWLGAVATRPEILAVSMIVLIFGMVLYLGGWAWAKELWFACAFLLFMLPPDFLDRALALPLRMFMTRVTTYLLNFFGMEVVQVGTSIHSLNGLFQDLDVAAPCSGIRSLVALMALTAIYGYVTMDKAWKMWVLFASSIPLAVIGNMARLTTIVFVAQGFGQKMAMRIYHDFAGFIVFGVAVLCMLAISTLLTAHYRAWIDYWMQPQPK